MRDLYKPPQSFSGLEPATGSDLPLRFVFVAFREASRHSLGFFIEKTLPVFPKQEFLDERM
jgi:hypothetical protein